MARLEINTGIAPTGLGGDTPRSASIKINTMTQEIYDNLPTPFAPLPITKGGTGGKSAGEVRAALGVVPVTANTDTTAGRLLTTGYGGVGRPLLELQGTPDAAIARNMGASFSYLSVPDKAAGMVADGALATFGANPDYAFQLACDWRSGAMFSRYKAGAEPSAWGQFIRTGDYGLGSNMTPLPIANIDTGILPTGRYYANAGNTGFPYAGHWGLAIDRVYDNYSQQVCWDINNPASTYERRVINGVVDKWNLKYNASNAILDPQGAGGLLSSTVVGGMYVQKFANGMMCVLAYIGYTPVIGANAVTPLTVNLPVAFATTAELSIHVSATPTQNYDSYGAVSTGITGVSSFFYVVRNGAVAQPFDTRLLIWGRWK